LAGQLGVVQKLDGREERVHVDVEDGRDKLDRTVDGHRGGRLDQGPM
jgi:hypothetical protein